MHFMKETIHNKDIACMMYAVSNISTIKQGGGVPYVCINVSASCVK